VHSHMVAVEKWGYVAYIELVSHILTVCFLCHLLGMAVKLTN
jgi:hypothetical protein